MAHAVVVGAGVAGISAAIHLTQRGWRVTLVEARSTVGGRATSVWDEVAGEFVDCGQHVFLGAYRELRGLLHILQTHPFAGPGERLRFLFCNGVQSFLFDAGRLPGPLGFLAALRHIPGLSCRDYEHLLRGLLRLLLFGNAEMTVAAFLRRFRQAEPAIAAFWKPLTFATMNAAPEEAALSLLQVVLRQGFFRGTEAARFFVPQRALVELFQPVGEWLVRHGGELRLRTVVRGLVFHGSGIRGVLTTTGECIRADAVVVATPPWTLPYLIPALQRVPAYAEFFRTAQYSPIVTIYLWLKEPVLPAAICAFPHPDLHWAFRRPTQYAAESVALLVSAAEHLVSLPRRQLLERCFAAFASAVPSFRSELVLHFRLMLERRATLRLTPQLQALRPDGMTPWRNLVLAGDWVQTGLPCTLESAARSGRAAAERLML